MWTKDDLNPGLVHTNTATTKGSKSWFGVERKPHARTYRTFSRNAEHLRVARLEAQKTVGTGEAGSQPSIAVSQPENPPWSVLIYQWGTYRLLLLSGNHADAAGFGW